MQCKVRQSDNNEVIVVILEDFAGNYWFITQDDVQCCHWSKHLCTLNPIVLYARVGVSSKVLSHCVISNNLEHAFVYKVPNVI